MHNPKVSLMIPAYNVETYIERCIKSAQAQTLKDIEIIVVNDGSTDQTADIIHRLAEDDPRIVIVDKQNGGLPSARNAGLSVARGEYYQILDGDDWLEPTACAELYTFAKKHDLDMVVCDYYLDDDKGDVSYKTVFEGMSDVSDRETALRMTYVESDSAMLCNRFVKKEIFDGIVFPEHISYGEDLLATSKLEMRAQRVGKYHHAFYHYIFNPSSITKDAVGKKMHQYFEAFLIIRSLLKENNLLDRHEKDLQVLECNKVAFFLFQKNYFGDMNYEKSLSMVLDYVRNHKDIPMGVSRIRRVFVRMMMLVPSKITFVVLSKISHLLRAVHG